MYFISAGQRQDSVAFDGASLDSEIHKLSDLESIGIKSDDDVHESFENDIGFSEGRYSVKLPWKQGHDPLPSNINRDLQIRLRLRVRVQVRVFQCVPGAHARLREAVTSTRSVVKISSPS